MYKIGQKVQIINTTKPVIGYIVKMEIDPIEWILYTIRVYEPLDIKGYTDYCCTEREIKNADD